MRLIDADFTVYAAESEFDEEDASKIRWLISHIPTVDAEPVRHGRWKNTHIGTIECSECGRGYNLVGMFVFYCPHCGAKMDLED